MSGHNGVATSPESVCPLLNRMKIPEVTVKTADASPFELMPAIQWSETPSTAGASRVAGGHEWRHPVRIRQPGLYRSRGPGFGRGRSESRDRRPSAVRTRVTRSPYKKS
jgi:hypothetical protein